MPPTINDLITWLGDQGAVRAVINGELQYHPYKSQDTYRFPWIGGMAAAGAIYRLRANLHHNGVLVNVWAQGIEGSVNRRNNPSAAIMQRRCRFLANRFFGTDFLV